MDTENLTTAQPAGCKKHNLSDWKGQLGWSFTGRESMLMQRAEESVAGFMEKYGRPPRLKSAEDEQREAEKALAEVMSTSEALEFLHISYKTLHNAVKRGELNRFEIPGKNGYFFKTADLQDFQLTLKPLQKETK